MNKKILIFGLIGNFGGIAVEVGFIADLLSKNYNVELLSSNKIDYYSPAVINHKNVTWNYIARKLYTDNFIIRTSSKLAKLINNRNQEAVNFIGNKISHKFYDLEKLHLDEIKKSIKNNDLVIFFGYFESKWLKEVVDYSYNNNTPFIFRTTGIIRTIPFHLANRFKENYLILVHSNYNLKKLIANNINNGFIVDQTSTSENKLLEISSDLNRGELTYGYLGRFGKEKGILEFLTVMKNLKKSLVFAGDGPLLQEVERLTHQESNFIYLGKLNTSEIFNFFEKIDVLVIPSFEESGPLVGIEAMAAAKLIISTRTGASMDRLDGTDNQFWFDIKEPNSLVETIQRVEDLPLEMLKKIKLQLRKKYTLNYSNTSLNAQYNRILESPTLNF